MTCERILALVNDVGVVISKRQLVRLLTTKLEVFRAEDAAVLKAGPDRAPISRSTTRAPVMRERTATPRRSARTASACFAPVRANRGFRSCRGSAGGPRCYVINQAALDYMKERALPQIVTIDKFAVHAGSCLRLSRAMGELPERARPGRDESHSRSGPDRHRRRALGRHPPSGLAAGHRHRLRRRRPIPRRRPRPVLGPRRAPRPQAGPRQRQTAQRHRGRPTDDLVALSAP